MFNIVFMRFILFLLFLHFNDYCFLPCFILKFFVSFPLLWLCRILFLNFVAPLVFYYIYIFWLLSMAAVAPYAWWVLVRQIFIFMCVLGACVFGFGWLVSSKKVLGCCCVFLRYFLLLMFFVCYKNKYLLLFVFYCLFFYFFTGEKIVNAEWF